MGLNLPTFGKINEMEISGKIIQVMQEVNGQGKNGTWRKQEFVLQQPGQYPKNLCMEIWGDKIDRYGLKEGMNVRAKIDLESREYNGRWYTNVKVWDLNEDMAGMPNPGTQAPPSAPASSDSAVGGTLPGAGSPPPSPPAGTAPFEDDLPF
ncbi:MAG: DUF3127 domain-containing protein [Bacteroidetes bacterium]|nr:DUF3127 domain-containing protein [Bacteroidota bacterium]